MRKLGIIAGGGPLPRRIAETHGAAGGAVFVIAFEGITPKETVHELEHAWVRLGRIQDTLDAMLGAGVKDVVMAGPIKRPALSSLDLDGRGAKLIFKAGRKAFGDDGLLSAIVAEIESDGLTVIGVDQVLGGVLAPAGLIGGPAPDPGALSDIQRGIEVLRHLGPVDVGQSIAVQEGLVLAVEAAEGTDAMIARAGALTREGPGPVLVKISKPGQERRADMPTVGSYTVHNARAAGVRGVAVEAESTLLLEADEVRRLAIEADLFVIGVDASETA
ncbi:MAG: UDP-2,3-diacylglucosamine diphosphatase LpxI [Alphaproteobacteria bacterium]|nr:UDP-2,3-diacylglucosamine diphosphatase LpxI [Alphaproteobacteria bacterium]